LPPSAAERIVIRTDGGRRVGLGHVRRCLALADALRRRRVHCHFVLHGDDDAATLVADAGYTVEDGPTADAAARIAARAVVLDSYELAPDEVAAIEPNVRVVAIDDLGKPDRRADVVTNSGVSASASDYESVDATLLLGPSYALLRAEFADEPARAAGTPPRVLLTVGGADPHDLTPLFVRSALAEVDDAVVDVVAGPFFERRPSAGERIAVHDRPTELRALMLGADIALSAAGHTLFELAATATPTVAVGIAENQRPNLSGFAARGTLLAAGEARDPDLERDVRALLRRLAADRSLREELGARGRALVDGQGADRVAEAILAG